jgi:sulfate adenylyltransferase subunit 1 (EFTu-like GTPase family)
MFKIGKVINYYEGIGITIVELSSTLSVGDTIKVYRNGDEILTHKITEIILNQKNVDSANSKDVIALHLNEKVQKGSEIYRTGSLGVR